MPKVVDHEKRKREIVHSALALFSQEGYHNASFGDIASASGLSRTNVYNYFKNKDEIFYFAVGEVLDTIARSIELIVLQKELNIAQKLQRIYQVFINDLEDGKDSSIILDLALRTKREDTLLASRLEERTKDLRAKIEQLLVSESSAMPQSQVAVAATLFFSLVESSMMHSLFTDSAFIQQNIGSILHILGK